VTTSETATERLIAPLTRSAADGDTIKTRHRVTWASGDFAVIGTTLQIVGEALCEAVDLRARETCNMKCEAVRADGLLGRVSPLRLVGPAVTTDRPFGS